MIEAQQLAVRSKSVTSGAPVPYTPSQLRPGQVAVSPAQVTPATGLDIGSLLTSIMPLIMMMMVFMMITPMMKGMAGGAS